MNKFFVILSSLALVGLSYAQEPASETQELNAAPVAEAPVTNAPVAEVPAAEAPGTEVPAETSLNEAQPVSVAPAAPAAEQPAPQEVAAPAPVAEQSAAPSAREADQALQQKVAAGAEPSIAPASDVGYNPDAPTDVRQAPGEGDNDVPLKKRPTYNYTSYGLGISVWHNYEDKKSNPKRDWDQGFVLRHGKIWEMGAYGALTLSNTTQFSFGDGWDSHWQWSEASRIGGRVYFADAFIAPFLGAGIGIGFQLDGHFNNFTDMFAIGIAFGGEVGFTIFRTSQTQLEIGCSYDSVLDNLIDELDFGRRFGSFNFYLAINY